MEIKMRQVRDNAFQPKYRDDDGGIDLALPYQWAETVNQVGPGTIQVPLGWAFEMEEGWHLLALQKSRHAGKMMVEAPLIDNAYRGEVHAMLTLIDIPTLEAGDYVMQLLPVWSPTPTITIVEDLSETERGDGAFGSTVQEGQGKAED